MIGLPSAAARHDLRVLARRRPPRGPAFFVDQAGERLFDLAGGQRLAGTLQQGPQELRRIRLAERAQLVGSFELAAQEVVDRERSEQA